MKCKICGKVVHYNRRQLRVRSSEGNLLIILCCNECFAKAEQKISEYLLRNPASALKGAKIEQ